MDFSQNTIAFFVQKTRFRPLKGANGKFSRLVLLKSSLFQRFAPYKKHMAWFGLGRSSGRMKERFWILVRIHLGLFEAARSISDGLFPADLSPGIADLVAHHRLQNPIAMRGITPREAPLHTAVAVVGLTLL